MKRDFYIYNPAQANFFLQKGLVPVEIGKLKGSVYIKFLRNVKSEEVFGEWCNQNKSKTLPESGSKFLKTVPEKGSEFMNNKKSLPDSGSKLDNIIIK